MSSKTQHPKCRASSTTRSAVAMGSSDSKFQCCAGIRFLSLVVVLAAVDALVLVFFFLFERCVVFACRLSYGLLSFLSFRFSLYRGERGTSTLLPAKRFVDSNLENLSRRAPPPAQGYQKSGSKARLGASSKHLRSHHAKHLWSYRMTSIMSGPLSMALNTSNLLALEQ